MALTDYVIMPGADYQAICDKVREGTGSTDALTSGGLLEAVGAMAAGGASNVKIAFGTTAGYAGSLTIEHGLGVVPDIVYIGVNNNGSYVANRIAWSFGLSSAFREAIGGTSQYFGSTLIKGSTSGKFTPNVQSYGMDELNTPNFEVSATETTFSIGTSLYYLDPSLTHIWFAVGGLTETE